MANSETPSSSISIAPNEDNQQISELSTIPTQDKATENKIDLVYGVLDTPPWKDSILLGFQQFLSFVVDMVIMPNVLCSAICMSDTDPARAFVMSTMSFVCSISTFLQNFIGIRLPLIQGMSGAFLLPITNLMMLPQFKCPTNNTFLNDSDANSEIWQMRMREVQGSVAIISIVPILLGASGLLSLLVRYITPLVIISTVSMIGLSLAQQAAILSEGNWTISLCTTLLIIICSKHLENIQIPILYYKRRDGFYIKRVYWFKIYPLITSVIIMWIICLILTKKEVLSKENTARTDVAYETILKTPWFKFPYPGQWGKPTASVTGIIGVLPAAFVVLIESIGAYYSCARLVHAPPPTPPAINRGILVEGFGTLLAGLFGTGSGTTSYCDCVSTMSLTKVACRRVMYIASVFMLILGVFTKFSAVMLAIPKPIVGGLMSIILCLIVGIGLSFAQYINLNSSRNIFILGFSIWFGSSMPQWISNNENSINTGYLVLDQVIFILLSSNMSVAGLTSFILDNTIPGSKVDRGICAWSQSSQNNMKEGEKFYDLPFGMKRINRNAIFRYIPVCPSFLRLKNAV